MRLALKHGHNYRFGVAQGRLGVRRSFRRSRSALLPCLPLRLTYTPVVMKKLCALLLFVACAAGIAWYALPLWPATIPAGGLPT